MRHFSSKGPNYGMYTAFSSIKILFSFLSHYLSENNYRLTNNFEGKGLKHYRCELFSVIVPMIRYDSMRLERSIKARSQKLIYFNYDGNA